MPDERRLVYSTDGTLPVPTPQRSKHRPAAPASVPADGVVRVGCEKRRGGTVTLIYGLAASAGTVGADLRRRCATGGTVKDGIVTLQGDHRDAALLQLQALGHRTKRMGG